MGEHLRALVSVSVTSDPQSWGWT